MIRKPTSQVIGEFESDADGEIIVKNILRDKYIIKEISAPEGYDLEQILLLKLVNLKHQKLQ